MDCPFCHSQQIFVTNSRPTAKGTQIWRRKKCLTCGELFTTYEKIDLSYLKVIKRNGDIQRYHRAKLFVSIYHPASEIKNADRGQTAEFAETITQEVEMEIIVHKQKMITTQGILDIVLKKIYKRSPSIFLKYLVYRAGDNQKTIASIVQKYFLK
jgi:transcriptional repressor NrdR